jgi:acetylglutamate kinase
MIGFCSSQGVYNQDGEIVSELFPNEAQARVKSWKRTKIITPAPCASCAGR